MWGALNAFTMKYNRYMSNLVLTPVHSKGPLSMSGPLLLLLMLQVSSFALQDNERCNAIPLAQAHDAHTLGLTAQYRNFFKICADHLPLL